MITCLSLERKKQTVLTFDSKKDTVLPQSVVSKSMRTIERHLQQCINRIEKWASHNGFKFSKSKTRNIRFLKFHHGALESQQ